MCKQGIVKKKPPWPRDFKRWLRVIHSELKTWYTTIGLYFWWFKSYRQFLLIVFILNAFLQDHMVLMIKNKIHRSKGGRLRFTARSLKISQQQNCSKLMLYWSQSKRISTPWTSIIKHVISCNVSARDGLRCNRWIVSTDFFREKSICSQKLRAKKNLIRARTKWRKARESAYPTNVLGSIVLLLSLSKILINNMFGVSYVSCNMLH